VERICPHSKVALGIRLLATYISIRPKELLSIQEKDIDLGNGYIYFPNPKEKKYKAVPILPADIETFRSYPLTFPAMPFFRHGKGVKGTTEHHPFNHNMLYEWWKKSCRNLKIDGVDLYGGTRHSSVRALRQFHSPEEIKQAAMSATNKAFDRYLGKPEDDSIRAMYGQAAQIIDIDKGLIARKTG
jgi:integrase